MTQRSWGEKPRSVGCVHTLCERGLGFPSHWFITSQSYPMWNLQINPEMLSAYCKGGEGGYKRQKKKLRWKEYVNICHIKTLPVATRRSGHRNRRQAPYTAAGVPVSSQASEFLRTCKNPSKRRAQAAFHLTGTLNTYFIVTHCRLAQMTGFSFDKQMADYTTTGLDDSHEGQRETKR